MKEYLVYFSYTDDNGNICEGNLFFDTTYITRKSFNNVIEESKKKYGYKVMVIKNIICLSDL